MPVAIIKSTLSITEGKTTISWKFQDMIPSTALSMISAFSRIRLRFSKDKGERLSERSEIKLR